MLCLFCAYDVHLTLILYTSYHMLCIYVIANEAFYDITHSSSSSNNQLPHSPLTIFELIESNSLPSLYGMLALALHNISIMQEASLPVEEEGDMSSLKEERDEQPASAAAQHLSITLPCKSFGDDDNSRYNITVRITMTV